MKKLLALIIAALMLFALAACNAGDEETTTTTDPTTTTTTTTTAASGETVTSPKGNITIKTAGDWEYKGEFSPNMLQFDSKATAGASVYISDKQDMELEAQKKSVGYAYPDKKFEELKIGENTYSYMQAKDDLAYLIAPTSNGYAIYIQVRGGTVDAAKVLLETAEIK